MTRISPQSRPDLFEFVDGRWQRKASASGRRGTATRTPSTKLDPRSREGRQTTVRVSERIKEARARRDACLETGMPPELVPSCVDGLSKGMTIDQIVAQLQAAMPADQPAADQPQPKKTNMLVIAGAAAGAGLLLLILLRKKKR